MKEGENEWKKEKFKERSDRGGEDDEREGKKWDGSDSAFYS